MDYILRATAFNENALVFVATTRNTVNEAFRLHQTSPVVSAGLGRTLTAAAIIGRTLKDEDNLLTITIKGDGPVGGIVVTGNNRGMVKGYPFNNIVDIPLKENGKLDVHTALGEGTLTVVKDLGLKEPYVSQIPLLSGEIAEDLTYYFAKSEQIPSVVSLGVLVDRDYTIKQAGGFMIQLLPNAQEELITFLEQKLGQIKPITTMLDENMTPEQILEYLVGGHDFKITEKTDVSYFCNCTKEKVEKALLSIGRKELNKIIEEDGQASLHCHFCNKDYFFDKEYCESLLKTI